MFMDELRLPLMIIELVFGVGILCRITKFEFSSNVTVILKKVFLFLCFVLLIVFILALFDVYFRGYWSTKVLIWIFMLTASFLYAFGNSKVLTSLWRIFTGIIFYFPLANILIYFLIPLFVPLLAFSIWLHILGDNKAIYYDDEEIRIQFPSSEGDYKGWPKLFIKKGIFEFDKGEMLVNYYFDPDSLKVEKTKDLITVYLFKKNFDPVPFTFKR